MVSLLHVQLIPAPASVLFLFQCLDFIASLPLQVFVASLGDASGSVGIAMIALFVNACVWAALLTLACRFMGIGAASTGAASVVHLDPYGSSLPKGRKKVAEG